MNIYKVQYKRQNVPYEASVAANTAQRAIEDAERYLKAQYYSYEITGCNLALKVDVFYKTPAKKSKKK